jgi:hypothetical protein
VGLSRGRKISALGAARWELQLRNLPRQARPILPSSEKHFCLWLDGGANPEEVLQISAKRRFRPEGQIPKIGIWVGVRCLRTRKNAVAYFSSRKRSASKATRNKAWKAQEPRGRGVEDLNGRRHARLRDGEGSRLSRRRYSCAKKASAVADNSGASQTLGGDEGFKRSVA